MVLQQQKNLDKSLFQMTQDMEEKHAALKVSYHKSSCKFVRVVISAGKSLLRRMGAVAGCVEHNEQSILLFQQLTDIVDGGAADQSAWQAFSTGLASTIRKLDTDEDIFHTLFALGCLALLFCGLCLPCISSKVAKCLGTCCCAAIKFAGRSQYHRNGGVRVATNAPTDEEWAH